MKTVVIQIGNSDNKLTQNEWAHYVQHVKSVVEGFAYTVQFCGGSDWDAPWQNACWVVEIEDDRVVELQQALIERRKSYQQESVAVTIGETEFI